MDIALSEQSKMGQTEHVLTLLLDCDVHQMKIQNIPFLGHPICPRIIFCPPANTKNVQVLCIIQYKYKYKQCPSVGYHLITKIQIQKVSKCWVSGNVLLSNEKKPRWKGGGIR